MTTVYLAPTDLKLRQDVDEVIKLALEKTGVQKEMDLCAYIPSLNGPLSSSTYLRLKDTEQETLFQLIKQHILDDDPRRVPIPSGVTHSEQSYSGRPLQECVQEAMAKLNVQKESALCRYIPYGEGYIHHFTYLKMKSANPVQARNLIQSHILDKRAPERVPYKPRKRRNIEASFNGAISVASQSDSGTGSETEPSSPQFSTGTEGKAAAKSYKDERIDQILGMVSRLAKTVRLEDMGSVSAPAGFSRDNAISLMRVEECIQLLQQQLIMKIIKKEADQNLWKLFTQMATVV